MLLVVLLRSDHITPIRSLHIPLLLGGVQVVGSRGLVKRICVPLPAEIMTR